MNFIYHQREIDHRAASSLARYALETNRRCLQFSLLSEIPDTYDGLISGSVETIQAALHKRIKPDYFPDWALPFAGRDISYVEDISDLQKTPSFLKPSDILKRFNGFLWNGVDEIDVSPPFQVQSPVKIISECRYYITNGEVVASGWYSPTEIEEKTSPRLPMHLSIPKEWSGTIDCAQIAEKDASIIVECHHPFSCGWYGDFDDFMTFGEWLENGWKYMKNYEDFDLHISKNRLE